MKKIIISTLTALALTTSAASFASVTNEEASYLFGTQEVVEMQVMSNTEMQNTEGQLFGITFEAMGSYVDQAIVVIKPVIAAIKPILGKAVPHLSAAFIAVKEAALKASAITLATVLSGL